MKLLPEVRGTSGSNFKLLYIPLGLVSSIFGMSKNIIVTIGHHTCSEAHHAYLMERAPFMSVYDEKQDKLPFLGSGYYFWDNNIDQAIYWGDTHYNGKYNIVAVDLELSGECFLDLIGSREDMAFFKCLVEQVSERRDDTNNWSISQFIECFRRINKLPGYEHFFECRIIRAIDSHAANQDTKKFNKLHRGSMPLNPRLIICFFDKRDIPLNTIRIIK
jgi:hypothetical protein